MKKKSGRHQRHAAGTVTRSGYLAKKSQGKAARWQRRYFTLSTTGSLNYADNETSAVEASYELSTLESVQLDQASGGTTLTLGFAGSAEPVKLQADTETDATEWKDAITAQTAGLPSPQTEPNDEDSNPLTPSSFVQAAATPPPPTPTSAPPAAAAAAAITLSAPPPALPLAALQLRSPSKSGAAQSPFKSPHTPGSTNSTPRQSAYSNSKNRSGGGKSFLDLHPEEYDTIVSPSPGSSHIGGGVAGGGAVAGSVAGGGVAAGCGSSATPTRQALWPKASLQAAPPPAVQVADPTLVSDQAGVA
jgi:hypothetical protein